jgi:hypothetical protein
MGFFVIVVVVVVVAGDVHEGGFGALYIPSIMNFSLCSPLLLVMHAHVCDDFLSDLLMLGPTDAHLSVAKIDGRDICAAQLESAKLVGFPVDEIGSLTLSSVIMMPESGATNSSCIEF